MKSNTHQRRQAERGQYIRECEEKDDQHTPGSIWWWILVAVKRVGSDSHMGTDLLSGFILFIVAFRILPWFGLTWLFIEAWAQQTDTTLELPWIKKSCWFYSRWAKGCSQYYSIDHWLTQSQREREGERAEWRQLRLYQTGDSKSTPAGTDHISTDL